MMWVRRSDRGFAAGADKELLIMGIDIKEIEREVGWAKRENLAACHKTDLPERPCCRTAGRCPAKACPTLEWGNIMTRGALLLAIGIGLGVVGMATARHDEK